tara:strand:+ start:2000 stop:2569 length:570 start_codon:yes stop_codon:yes gene_type:complete
MFRYITAPIFAGIYLTTDVAIAAESSGGMPQLNPSYFSSQIFWLIVFFSTLFFFINSFFFPRLNQIRENREKVINECLIEAKEIHKEIEEMSIEMEKNLKAAKEVFDSKIKSEFENNKELYDKEINSINQLYDKKKSEVNEVMLETRNKLYQDIDKLAVDLSDKIYFKIMNEKITGSTSELKKLGRGNS